MQKTPSGWGGIFGPETRARGLPIDAADGHGGSDALRHSYASLLLVAGVDVYYVSRMPGHASIRETVDTYGRWPPANRRGALDVLDDAPTDTGPTQSASNLQPNG